MAVDYGYQKNYKGNQIRGDFFTAMQYITYLDMSSPPPAPVPRH